MTICGINFPKLERKTTKSINSGEKLLHENSLLLFWNDVTVRPFFGHACQPDAKCMSKKMQSSVRCNVMLSYAFLTGHILIGRFQVMVRTSQIEDRTLIDDLNITFIIACSKEELPSERHPVDDFGDTGDLCHWRFLSFSLIFFI